MFDLYQFSAAAATSGNPPIMGTTVTAWLEQWGDTQARFAQIISSNSLAGEYSNLVNHLNQLVNSNTSIVSDVDDPQSPEAREAMAAKIYHAALDGGTLHPELQSIYEARLAAIDSGDIKAGRQLSNWMAQAISELTYRNGIVKDGTGGYTYTGTLNEPVPPGDETLIRYRGELGLTNTLADFTDRLPDTSGVPLGGGVDVGNITTKFSAIVDHLAGLGQVLSPDGTAVIDANNTLSNIADIANRVNGALASLAGTSGAEFQRITNNMFDALNDLNKGFADAMSKIPGGSYIAFAGTALDAVQLAVAASTAYDQYMAGDTQGAMNTLADASASILISTAASYVAGIAAVALGASAIPVIAAAFAAGIAAGLLWDQFADNNPDWLQVINTLFNGRPTDPLVIDLDNDGIELTSLNGSNAYFDLDGDSFQERTGWVSPNDGLLAVDINGNGKIDDISELFGSATASGFAKLAAYDTNGNGVVNAQDSQFGNLRIWQDLNGNGQTDSGELHTLPQAGVASISLNASSVNYQVNGNQVIKTAAVTMANGVVTQAAEVLFAMSQAQSKYILPTGFTYDADVFSLPILRGFGDIPDLWVSMSQSDQVKADAHALIDQAKAGNFTGFENAFDNMLADWAGVANVVWMQDAPQLSAAFAFDQTEYDQWWVRENDGISGFNPLPTIRGYVFHTGLAISAGGDYYAKIDEWLATNGYVAPDAHGGLGASGGPQLSVQINGGFTQQTLPFRIVPGTLGSGLINPIASDVFR